MSGYISIDNLNPDGTYVMLDGQLHEACVEYGELTASYPEPVKTADVAPVVRCQGCELCKPQDIKNTYDNKTERGLFCHYWQQKVYPDDFCSYGERKAVE